jgi:protein-S-isoprenylcysteine O-methyltransferase Ste14
MRDSIKKTGKCLFKIRGYIPLPFLIVCLFFFRFDPYFFFSGFLLILAGECVRIFSVGYLGISSRKTSSAGGDRLIINGPYRFVRNPIYIGNMSIYLGFAVLSNIFFPVFPLITIVFFMFVYNLIARYEESELSSLFGKQYEFYLRQVSRFLPFRAITPSMHTPDAFNIWRALRSERTTLWIILLVFVMLAVKHYTL